MNTVYWYNYTDTNVDYFLIYRSIPGIQFLFSSVVTPNPVFRYSVNDQEVKELVLNPQNITSLVSTLDLGLGITVNATSDNLSVQIRMIQSTNKTKLRIFPSGFASDIGYPNGTIIIPELYYYQIAAVGFADQTEPYAYQDNDGSPLDYYKISTRTNGVETFASITQKPLLPGVNYCALETRFINIQGRPVEGVEIKASPAYLDIAGLTTNVVKCVSDAYGRISLPLQQGFQYRVEIPAVGFSKFIDVPTDTPYLDLASCPSTTSPEFSPNGDPS